MYNMLLCYTYILYSGCADPERFDADPDPSFQADADPDPAPDPNLFFLGREKNFVKIFTYSFQNLNKLYCLIFSVTMQEEG